MNQLRRCSSLLFAVLISANVSATLAQTARTAMRDPTLPPGLFGAPAGGTRSVGERFKHLVTVEGEHYVIWNSRRYSIGETLMGARIERITEADVWLRGKDGLRKLPLFSGVEKRPPTSTQPTSTAPVTKPTRTAMDKKNGPIK